MKKLSTFLIAALITVLGLTSCLDGDNKQSAYSLGVITYSSKNFMTPVVKTLGGEYYGQELDTYVKQAKLNIGDYISFYFTIDFDLPENSAAMVEANGYQTVSITPLNVFEKQYTSPYLTDTALMKPNEVAVTDILYSDGISFGYAESYLCMLHVIANFEKDVTVTWDMSYDSDKGIMSEESGRRYYNLFVRATADSEGDGKTKIDYGAFNAYYLKSFLESAAREEKDKLGSSYSSQSSTFYVKFNYVSEIKEDKITWGNKSAQFPIYLFVSEQ